MPEETVVEQNAWERFWEKVGAFFMSPDDSGINYLTRILIAIAVIVVGFLLGKLLEVILKKLMGIKKKGPQIDNSGKFFLVTIIKIFYGLCIAFVVISLLKIEITGIAGITSAITVALGLALQDLISCFASGALIIQQKNIASGDFICVQNSYGSCEGTVKEVHFFFTYLTTPSGQEVTIPNNNMQKAVITNYTRLGKRRLDYDVGVSYDTDIELAEQTLKSIVENDERILPDDGVSIYVYELGAYSVGIRIRVWTSFSNYWPLYNELSEKVLLAFRDKNINIPSSTDLNVKKDNLYNKL